MSRRIVLPAVVGVGGAAAVTAGLSLGLAFPPLIAGALGVVIGAGGAFLTTSTKSEVDERAEADAKRVVELLSAAVAAARSTEPRLRMLQAQELWQSSPLDENLQALCRSVQGVAALPALSGRSGVDGDILMLHAIATDYLPNVVRLATEHDRMFAGMSEASREEVRASVADLNEQAVILADAVRRIESDILRGTGRDVAQHTEYLRARFTESGVTSAVDFDRAFAELEKGSADG